MENVEISEEGSIEQENEAKDNDTENTCTKEYDLNSEDFALLLPNTDEDFDLEGSVNQWVARMEAAADMIFSRSYLTEKAFLQSPSSEDQIQTNEEMVSDKEVFTPNKSDLGIYTPNCTPYKVL